MGQTAIMLRGLNDNLVSTNTLHRTIDAILCGVQVTLNAQCRKLVGNNAHLPAWFVGLTVSWTYGKNLCRSFRFLPRAERAGCHRRDLACHDKLTRLGDALVFYDDPGPPKRIPSEFWHNLTFIVNFAGVSALLISTGHFIQPACHLVAVFIS